VFETPKPGWLLNNIACNFTNGTGNFMIIGANPNPAFQPGDNEVNFSGLTPPGANLQCTYTNTSCKDVMMNLSTGQNPNWTVSSGTVGVTTPVSSWVQPSGGVRWIQPSTAGSPQDFPAGNYQYSVPFTLGPLAQYATITISGKYAADNSVISVTPPAGPLCSPPNNNCFSAWHPLNITSGFQAGNNTLVVTVYNNPFQGGPTKTGLVVDATLRAVCKKIK
jgi:hypothetical protein